jgi:hypothetical protein
VGILPWAAGLDVDDYTMPPDLPPDLQAAVQWFGGYDKIPPSVWALYNKQLVATHEWLAARHKVIRRRKYPSITRR